MQSVNSSKNHMRCFNPSKDCKGSPSTLKDYIFNSLKDWRITCNPSILWRIERYSTLRRITNAIIWRVEGFHAIFRRVEGWHSPYFDGLKDCKHNPSRLKCFLCEYSKGWRITHEIVVNPSKSWRTVVLSQSFEGLKNSVQSFKGLNDCMRSFACIPSILRRITCNPSILRRITKAILQPWRIAFLILWRVEGFRLLSFDGLKDYMQSFNPSKDYECNPSRLEDYLHGSSKGWRIVLYLTLWRVEGLQSFHNSLKGCRIAFKILQRFEGVCAILQLFEA